MDRWSLVILAAMVVGAALGTAAAVALSMAIGA